MEWPLAIFLSVVVIVVAMFAAGYFIWREFMKDK